METLTAQYGYNGTDFQKNCMSVTIRNDSHKFMFTLQKTESIPEHLFVKLLTYKAIKFYKQLFIK